MRHQNRDDGERLPFLIETNKGEFYMTKYTGMTSLSSKFGAGHRTREYWHCKKGENVRLHRLQDGRFWIE